MTAILWTASCGGNPVEDCLSDTIDCCESDLQCFEVYGAAFPECVDPGPSTGTCSECATNEHCPISFVCDIEDAFGVCVPE